MPPTAASIIAEQVGARAVASERADTLLPITWVAGALLASLAVLAWLMGRSDLNIDPLAPATMSFTAAFAVAGALRYVFRAPNSPRERTLRDLAEYYGLFMGMGLIGAVAAYPVAAETHGYVDAGLQRADTLLHFHWLAWYQTVSDHRALQLIGTVAYESIFVSPAILLGYFARQAKRAAAYRFLTAFWISAILALTLFHFMPAVGPLAYLSKGNVPYLPDSELYMADLIPVLRVQAIHLVDLGAIRGLVSCPSFHTVSGVLFIATAWPHKPLRWPLTALNIAMLIATPIEGTHYLTDMILGAVIGVIALGLTKALFAHLADRRRQAGSTAISVTP